MQIELTYIFCKASLDFFFFPDLKIKIEIPHIFVGLIKLNKAF